MIEPILAPPTAIEPEVVGLFGDPDVAEIGVLRFRDDDRLVVETVDGLTPPLPRHEKWIVNVSTQFGCPVRCPFCDASEAFHGNCSTDDLLAQVRWALARHPADVAACRKLKVHFARMGEPSLNDAVLDALVRLPAEVASPGLWACLATIAPRGREAWFERLLAVKEDLFRGRFQLQFSVQSTDAAERARLIPVPHWSLARIATYGRRFYQPGDRRIVLNLALARGVPFDPAEILRHFEPAAFAIKLTPVNPTARGQANGVVTVLRSDDDTAVRRAADVLLGEGYDVVLSVGDAREDQVGSNCGQAVRVARE